mmetsp:Transcript_3740/g.10680  ORF Transcript_3740/g.10680 Transcript_3740/m.10680 type:complete len:326 (+) Transcript_3740:461-1438(+)
MFSIVYGSSIAVVVMILYYTESGQMFSNSECSHTESGMPETELPKNLWALNLAAAVGQVSVQGKPLWPSVVAILSIIMGFLQSLALFLVAHDINPNAVPVTEIPSTPWVHTGWSVNTMKWIMVVFLSLFMVNEAADCRTTLEGVLVTNGTRFKIWKYFVFAVVLMQFGVVLLVVWCGVSAILSFQAVPDILYSSMAVTFIASVDESFFQLLKNLLDVEADFIIVHGASLDSVRSKVFQHMDKNQDGVVTREEYLEWEGEKDIAFHELNDDYSPTILPVWQQVALRMLTVAPFILGFGLIARAFYTNIMPTDRVHALKRDILYYTG